MLQSQLFVLKVFVACIVHHWKCVSHDNDPAADPALPHPNLVTSDQSNGDSTTLPRGWEDPPPMDDTLAKHVLSVMASYVRSMSAREDATFGYYAGSSALGGTSDSQDVRGSKGESSSNFTKRSMPSDRSLRDIERSQTSSLGSVKAAYGMGQSSKSRDDSSAVDLSSRDRDGDWNGTGSSHGDGPSLSSLTLASSSSLFILHASFPPTRSPFQLPPKGAPQASLDDPPHFSQDSWQSPMATHKEMDSVDSLSSLVTSIYRHASQVIFYLSASNWAVVHARIRNRLAYLSTTAEESPNTAELRLLECSNLQRARLGSVIQGRQTVALALG